MAKTRSIATRMEVKTITELKKIFPHETPSSILRILAEERLAIQRNTKSLMNAKALVKNKKSERDFL